MWKTLLWLSLGATLGMTGSTLYLHLTQQVTVAAPACMNTMGDADGTVDWSGTPHGHLPALSK